MKDRATKSATSQICKPLWARLRNGTVDRLESHRQLGLTLFDSYYRLTRDQNKKWSPETTQKNGAEPEKPYE